MISTGSVLLSNRSITALRRTWSASFSRRFSSMASCSMLWKLRRWRSFPMARWTTLAHSTIKTAHWPGPALRAGGGEKTTTDAPAALRLCGDIPILLEQIPNHVGSLDQVGRSLLKQVEEPAFLRDEGESGHALSPFRFPPDVFGSVK